MVTDYLAQAGPARRTSRRCGFHLVGYGCTTCIGNCGPLPEPVARGGRRRASLVVAAVLSGNRNFEGRINPQVRANYLASPPLVVAYALAGTHGHRPHHASRSAPDRDGSPVYLRDIWPSHAGDRRTPCAASVTREMFRQQYADVFDGRRALERDPACRERRAATPGTQDSHLHQAAAVLRRHAAPSRAARGHRRRARAGAARRLGHHRPHLARRLDRRRTSPAGRYLIEHGVDAARTSTPTARGAATTR